MLILGNMIFIEREEKLRETENATSSNYIG